MLEEECSEMSHVISQVKHSTQGSMKGVEYENSVTSHSASSVAMNRDSPGGPFPASIPNTLLESDFKTTQVRKLPKTQVISVKTQSSLEELRALRNRTTLSASSSVAPSSCEEKKTVKARNHGETKVASIAAHSTEDDDEVVEKISKLLLMYSFPRLLVKSKGANKKEEKSSKVNKRDANEARSTVLGASGVNVESGSADHFTLEKVEGKENSAPLSEDKERRINQSTTVYEKKNALASLMMDPSSWPKLGEALNNHEKQKVFTMDFIDSHQENALPIPKNAVNGAHEPTEVPLVNSNDKKKNRSRSRNDEKKKKDATKAQIAKGESPKKKDRLDDSNFDEEKAIYDRLLDLCKRKRVSLRTVELMKVLLEHTKESTSAVSNQRFRRRRECIQQLIFTMMQQFGTHTATEKKKINHTIQNAQIPSQPRDVSRIASKQTKSDQKRENLPQNSVSAPHDRQAEPMAQKNSHSYTPFSRSQLPTQTAQVISEPSYSFIFKSKVHFPSVEYTDPGAANDWWPGAIPANYFNGFPDPGVMPANFDPNPYYCPLSDYEPMSMNYFNTSQPHTIPVSQKCEGVVPHNLCMDLAPLEEPELDAGEDQSNDDDFDDLIECMVGQLRNQQTPLKNLEIPLPNEESSILPERDLGITTLSRLGEPSPTDENGAASGRNKSVALSEDLNNVERLENNGENTKCGESCSHLTESIPRSGMDSPPSTLEKLTPHVSITKEERDTLRNVKKSFLCLQKQLGGTPTFRLQAGARSTTDEPFASDSPFPASHLKSLPMNTDCSHNSANKSILIDKALDASPLLKNYSKMEEQGVCSGRETILTYSSPTVERALALDFTEDSCDNFSQICIEDFKMLLDTRNSQQEDEEEVDINARKEKEGEHYADSAPNNADNFSSNASRTCPAQNSNPQKDARISSLFLPQGQWSQTLGQSTHSSFAVGTPIYCRVDKENPNRTLFLYNTNLLGTALDETIKVDEDAPVEVAPCPAPEPTKDPLVPSRRPLPTRPCSSFFVETPANTTSIHPFSSSHTVMSSFNCNARPFVPSKLNSSCVQMYTSLEDEEVPSHSKQTRSKRSKRKK